MVLGSVFFVVQGVLWLGFWKVSISVYLILGFMVGFETRQSQGHKLWFLVIPMWLPLILYGLLWRKAGSGLVDQVNQKIAEEEVDKY